MKTFIESLDIAKKTPLSTELSRWIDQRQYNQLIDFVKKGIHRKDKAFLQLESLDCDKAIKFKKSDTGLDRSFIIKRLKDGTFWFVVLTKRKLAGGHQKKLDAVASGTFKKGKNAFVLNVWNEKREQKPLFALVAKKSHHTAKIMKEVEKTQAIGSPFIDSLILGHTEKGRCTVFSAKAISDLGTFIKNKRFSHEESDMITYALLKGVKEIHDKNYIHNDLKPANILIAGETISADPGFLKISDLGFLTEQTSKTPRVCGTLMYFSPEIALYYKKNKLNEGAIYPGKQALLLSEFHFPGFQEMPDYSKEFHFSRHKSNDMWAVGVIIFQILNQGKRPNIQDERDRKKIFNNPLLLKILTKNAEFRLTIDQAIEIHEEEMRKKDPIKVSIEKRKPGSVKRKAAPTLPALLLTKKQMM